MGILTGKLKGYDSHSDLLRIAREIQIEDLPKSPANLSGSENTPFKVFQTR
jgi:hypothetical protein